MKFSTTFVAITLLAIGVQAHQLPSLYAGQRRGDQFVTGPCNQDSDCQQGCCAFNTGKCAGPGIAQTRDGGCGFKTGAPNCNVAAALKLNVCAPGAKNGDLSDPEIQKAAAFVAKLDNLPFTPTPQGGAAAAPKKGGSKGGAKGGSKGGAKGGSKGGEKGGAKGGSGSGAASSGGDQSKKLTVFEQCSADSDCQQGCCGFSSGKCAGPAVAQTNGSGGCGHGNAKPNCDVATVLGFGGSCIAGASADRNGPGVQAAAQFAANLDGITIKAARR